MSQEKSVLTQRLTTLQQEVSQFAESLPNEQGEVAVSAFLKDSIIAEWYDSSDSLCSEMRTKQIKNHPWWRSLFDDNWEMRQGVSSVVFLSMVAIMLALMVVGSAYFYPSDVEKSVENWFDSLPFLWLKILVNLGIVVFLGVCGACFKFSGK